MEKRPRIQGCCVPLIASTECPLEIREVATDHRFVEPQRPSTAEQRWLAELLPKRVDGLTQCPSGTLGIAVRPQKARQSVSAYAVFTTHRHEGEQRQRLVLLGDLGNPGAIALDGQATEHVEPEHLTVR